MIDWKRKLTSRKLWESLAGFVAGLIVAIGWSESVATQVTGLIMSMASIVSYVIGEGLIDAANAGNANDISGAITLYSDTGEKDEEAEG